MRHRGSRDKNHNPVRMTFETLGCSVADLALAGVPGFPDLVVGCMGRTYLVEVKNPDTHYGKAGLSTEQSAFARDWRGAPVVVVTGVFEVVTLVNRWRGEAVKSRALQL